MTSASIPTSCMRYLIKEERDHEYRANCRLRFIVRLSLSRAGQPRGFRFPLLRPIQGTFLLCTFWLAQAQALAGEIEQARKTFDGAIAYANDVGLLAEEVDPASNELLGNFPQAFSHIGLVNAAWAISQAE
jgi:GH15 family glucan-1,4-alpha-glucosidase